MSGNRLIDLSGKRFGRLVVSHRVPSNEPEARWSAACDCGRAVEVRGSHLRRGRTTSCGCLRNELVSKRCTVREVGRTYGRLTVVAQAGVNDYEQAIWLCICECGNESVVSGVNLRLGKTKSCGCLNDGSWHVKPVVKYGAAHRRVHRLRGPAKNHPCHDCGQPGMDWSYQGGDPNELVEDNQWKSPYSLDPDYYVARCRLCHNHFDKGVRT